MKLTDRYHMIKKINTISTTEARRLGEEFARMAEEAIDHGQQVVTVRDDDFRPMVDITVRPTTEEYKKMICDSMKRSKIVAEHKTAPN